MREFLDKRMGLDNDALKRGLLMALAAWLAYALACIWHATNAYWAAMAVWVVIQPLRGMLFERAAMRLIGTMLGAAVGFLIIWCVPGSLLQIFFLSIWTTYCAGAMHIYKGIYPYGLLLSGITASAVVLPSALTNSFLPQLAWSRVLYTFIGVVVVTIVMSLYTPKASRKEYYAQARQLAADAVDFATRLLKGLSSEEAGEREQDVLFRMSQLESSAHTVAAGSVTGHKQLRFVEALIASAMEVMASCVAIHRQMQHEEGHTVSDEEIQALCDYFTRLTENLRQDDVAFKALLAQPEVITRHMPVQSDIAQRACTAIEQLVAATSALYQGQKELVSRHRLDVSPPKLATSVEIDWAKQSAVVAGVTTLGISLLAWLSGSHAAGLMALGVCMFSMVLASLPFPRMSMKTMFAGVVVGSAVALFYRLLVLPYMTTLPQLLASLVPFMLAGGLARASRKTSGPALDGNTNFLLVAQAIFPVTAVSTPQIIAESFSVVFGIAGACVVGLLLLPRRADDQAHMAATKLIRDIQRMLERSPEYFKKVNVQEDWNSQTEREVLRMMLHLGAAKALRKKLPRSILGILNLGSAIVRLQKLGTPVSRQGLQAMTYFAEDIHATIRAIWNLARENPDDSASNILFEAADALVVCEQLLQFVSEPSEEKLT